MAGADAGTGLRAPARWIVAATALAAGLAAAWWLATRASRDPEVIRRSAEAAVRAGRLDEGEDALARLPALGPSDRLLEATIARAKDRPGEALAALAQISDGDPLAAQARLLAGQIELRRKRLRVAEGFLTAAAERDPTLIQAHRELIYIYSVQLRRRELTRRFLALAREVPLTFDNVFHWCLTRNVVWEPHEQVGHLREFLDADAEDRWSRLALAESLRHLGQLARSRGLLAVLPEADPEARAVRARIALDEGDGRAAEALLAGGPLDHPELARLRGRFALARHDAASAARHFRLAYEAEPDNRDAVFGLAAALAALGDRAEAERFRALSKGFDTFGSLMARAASPANRDDPALMKRLGAACEAVGMHHEAYAWYQLCIRITPLDQDAQMALARLAPYDPRRR